jgi:hypothetical protein
VTPPRLLAPLLLLLALPAGAQNWVRYGVDAAGRTLYYEPSTIQVIGQHTRVWQLYDHKRTVVSSKNPEVAAVEARIATMGAPSELLLTEFDCKEARTRYLASTIHDLGMGKGAVISSVTYASNSKGFQWQFISPGHPYAVLLKLVCARGK